MRAPFVTAPRGNLRHNYGVERTTYVHRALDVFVPPDDPRWRGAPGFPAGSPGELRAPGDGILTDYHDVDSGAGGFWVKFACDNGEAWYFAHCARKPALPRGTRVAAGTFLTHAGWTGNAGPGNETTRGRRTEPHVHAECKVRVGGQWFHADPWLALCALWGQDPRAYKHDGIAMPFVVSQSDLPVTVDVPTTPPRSGIIGNIPGLGGSGGRGGSSARGFWRRLVEWLDAGVVAPDEAETLWEN